MTTIQDLKQYLRTGELEYDPHENPEFIELLKRFLVRKFTPLEETYQTQRAQLILENDFSARDIIKLTYQIVLDVFLEYGNNERKEEILEYALKNFDFMSLEQLLEEIPSEEPPRECKLKRYDIFGNVISERDFINFSNQYVTKWQEYMFWMINHFNSLTDLNEEERELFGKLRGMYSARYEDSVPDPEKPFRIYAFRSNLTWVKNDPERALGKELSDFSHELVHFFQEYLLPEDYDLIYDKAYSDVIATGISSLLAYVNGLDPCDDDILMLSLTNPYYVGASLALKCRDDPEPLAKFREELADVYLVEVF